MKKMMALLLSMMLVLGMFASVAMADEAKWDTSKQDKIVLSVMNNYYTKGWQTMAEKYHELHPETEVIVDVVADNDSMFQKFTTWFASDDLSDASDITHINFGNITNMQQKGQIYDFSAIMNEVNPYTGRLVSEDFDAADVKNVTNENGQYSLPFDHVGVAMIANVDMLKANGLDVPATMEEWLAACETLKANGIDTPVLATQEGSWFISVLADAAYRGEIGKWLIQPGDGIYREELHAANVSYAYDPDDLTCDDGVVFNDERLAMEMTDTQFDTPVIRSIWAEYAKYAPYFNANFMSSSSTEVLTSFELQEGAFLVSGSWNVGVLNKDMLDMGDQAFEWVSMAFPDYETAPEGWSSGKMRSLYVNGNCMGIILTGDEDHTARVVDFFEFVYSPEGAATMFDETLSIGQFVQGPVAIKGVELPEELSAKLEGFVSASSCKDTLGHLAGYDMKMSEDSGTYNDLWNKLTTGDITADEFVEALQPLALAKLADNIEVGGWDLDPATENVGK